jgi:hypothetical protein
MHRFILILLLFLSNLSFGQRWKQILGTNIEYSHFTRDDNSNYSQVSFEYFRKGEQVIGVARHLTSDFLSLFKETPIAFDIIFKSSPRKTVNKFDGADSMVVYKMYDTSIFKIRFKEAVMIENCRGTLGYQETIWQLTVHSWSFYDPPPCFINVVFNMRKKPHRPGNSGLKFVTAFDAGCEL